MKAIWNGKVIAESSDTVIVEGNHYFPMSSVRSEYLVDSDKTTSCPHKGIASYFSLTVDGDTNVDAAWYYDDPKPTATRVRDRIAFWRGVMVVD